VTAIGVWLGGSLRRDYYFKVRVSERQNQVDVFAVEGVENLPHHLHVLLRNTRSSP
jgi:hypothetical protein